jgi:hypothetical protein
MLLAVPLPPGKERVTFREWSSLLSRRVEWMAEREDAKTVKALGRAILEALGEPPYILDDRNPTASLAGLLRESERVLDVLVNLVPPESLGKPADELESDPEAVDAVANTPLESWLAALWEVTG